MKIAYIIDWDLRAASGVIKKISGQIAAWEAKGQEVTLCIIAYKAEKHFLPAGIKNIQIFERKELKYLFLSPFKTFIGRNAALKKAVRFLRKNKPDIVYYRQSTMWYPVLINLCRRFTVVIEVNTLDIKEQRLFGKKVSKWVYLYGQNWMNKKVRGFITVTDEIAMWYKRYHKPIGVIANGIGVPNKLGRLSIYYERPQLLFIGTPHQKWHGVEKIYYMASRLPEFDFNIIGYEPENGKGNLKNVIEHGYISNNEKLENIYHNMNIGIGTLSLYVNEMQEACPLKVREYVAHGLPVILGYMDTDLAGRDFVLEIGNYPRNVEEHIAEIKNFVLNNYKRKLSKETAEEVVGIQAKEARRLAFFKELAG